MYLSGLKEDYTREIISIVNFPNESAQGWSLVFESIKERNVKSLGLVVSDGLTGLDKKIVEIFGKTPHQKCIVHLQRNLSAYVRNNDKKELAADFRAILSPDDNGNSLEKVEEKLKEMSIKWLPRYKSLSKYLDKLNWQPYFVYLQFDVRIRRMIYTTNWIERFNKSCRRTLKIRGSFPSEESVLALITSVAKDKSEGKYRYPIYTFKYEEKLKRPRTD